MVYEEKYHEKYTDFCKGKISKEEWTDFCAFFLEELMEKNVDILKKNKKELIKKMRQPGTQTQKNCGKFLKKVLDI